jgi:glutamate/tyrosine decarboxylase-like PLP-dependent enzyme
MVGDPADIRATLMRAVEHALTFRETIAERPQKALRRYPEIRSTADFSTPEDGLDGEKTIEALASFAEPGLNAMIGPRFFGWVIGASHPVGLAADWLTGAWGQNTGNHHATPSAAVAEEIAAGWLLDILHLPPGCSVGFVTGATMANFVCLAAARGRVLRHAGWDVERDGLFGAPPIEILLGDDAHATVFAALQMLGLGRDRVRRIPTDEAGRIVFDEFARMLDASSGPVIVAGQAGQINTGAFDPIGDMADAVHARGGWLHVDGAFGLWARACPEKAALADGADNADSWATDGHKWLQTPYDCGYAIVAHPDDHRRAMTAAATYLPSAEGDERDPSHLVPELSRRARGFATWAMIRHLGRTGIADMVARHCRQAARFAEALSREPGVAVLNDICLNQAIVRFGGREAGEKADRLTERVIARIQSDGICFVGGARWRGRWVMRLSVISWPTADEDIETSIAAIVDAWRTVRKSA